jgi:uncharacterized membrane protein
MVRIGGTLLVVGILFIFIVGATTYYINASNLDTVCNNDPNNPGYVLSKDRFYQARVWSYIGVTASFFTALIGFILLMIGLFIKE